MKPYYQDEWTVLYHDDCLNIVPALDKIPLIITSPPYNLGVDYGDGVDDCKKDYANWLFARMEAMSSVLIDGGRLCLNLPAHTSRTLGGFEVLDVPSMAKDVDLSLRATHIWFKPNHVGGTAWGSWLSPSCPTALPNHEYIFVFDKGYKRMDRKGHGDATKEEFVQFIKTTWSFSPAIKINSKGKNTLGHNAPFPDDLPYRCLKLHSWPEDTILDPFAGSGTTLLVARREKRKAIGVEISQESCSIAAQRLAIQNKELS